MQTPTPRPERASVAHARLQFQRLTLGLLLCLPLGTAAQIYKWVDANGKVHYTDQKPPAHARSAEDLTGQIDSSVTSPDAGELRRRAYLKSADRLDEPSGAASGPEGRSAGDVGACWRARVHAEVLKLSVPVYRSDRGALRPQWVPDPYKGPRTYIKDAERSAVVAENRRLIETHCAEPNDLAAQLAAYNGWLARDWCDSATADLADAQAPNKRPTKERLARLEKERQRHCGLGG